MKREEVLNRIYSARTLPQILTAKKLRGEYLSQFPDDHEVLEVGAMLCRLEEAIRAEKSIDHKVATG